MTTDNMTPKQAAAKVGCSHTTILRAIHRGQLKAKKVSVPAPINQEWYSIAPADLEEWNTGPYRRKRSHKKE